VLDELRITGLALGDAALVDLRIVRHADDVGVNVLRREGDARVTVRK
jgi:hypothetical protein